MQNRRVRDRSASLTLSRCRPVCSRQALLQERLPYLERNTIHGKRFFAHPVGVVSGGGEEGDVLPRRPGRHVAPRSQAPHPSVDHVERPRFPVWCARWSESIKPPATSTGPGSSGSSPAARLRQPRRFASSLVTVRRRGCGKRSQNAGARFRRAMIASDVRLRRNGPAERNEITRRHS